MFSLIKFLQKFGSSLTQRGKIGIGIDVSDVGRSPQLIEIFCERFIACDTGKLLHRSLDTMHRLIVSLIVENARQQMPKCKLRPKRLCKVND